MDSKQKYTFSLFIKRLIDLAFAVVLIILTSPVMLITALLLKLESKAPVLYISRRVGANYEIFDLYKFRSMIPDADSKLAEMSDMNMYKTGKGGDVQGHDYYDEDTWLYQDGEKISETEYLKQKAEKEGAAFKKFESDPRITKLGTFIRNTSIDELPQLFNILKGNMSIVGNRPLPLYEAERLTTDYASKRFLAPAGLTGLWQVTKRGKADMTEEERIDLDVYYAENFSLWLDLKIILKTFPAVFQSEKV